MEGFEWVAELKDQLSGPAEHMQKSLRGVHDELKHTGGVLEELKGHFIPSVTAAELFAHGIEKVGELAIEAAHKLAEFAFEGAKFAIEAREFREQMEASFSLFLGSAEAGEETFNEVRGLSKELHAPIEQIGELTNQLLIAGLDNQESLRKTVETVSTLQRVGAEAGAGKIKGIVEKSLAAGHFSVTEKALKGTGVKIPELYATIGQQLGIGQNEVKARLKAGKIDIETGINALDQAIVGGKVGERARTMFKLGDLAVDFKNTMQEIFEGIDSSEFLDALKEIGVLFDKNNASGQGLRAILVGAFTQIFHWAKIATDKMILGFIYAQIYIYKAYNALVPVIRIFRGFVEIIPWMLVLKAALVAIGVAIGLIAGPFIGLALAGIAFWGLMVNLVEQAKIAFTNFGDWFSKFWSSFSLKDVATALIDGLVQGITAGASRVWDAIKGVAQGALNTAKGVLGIHSPSIEMAKLGQFTTAGFSQGVESGQSDSKTAMSNAMKPPNLERPQGTAGGRTITINLGGVQITGVKGAEEMAPMFETMFTDLLERVAQEVRG